MNIGKTIKQKRIELSLSQQQLASSAEISLTTLQNIEANQANPSIDIIQKIISSLGLGFNFYEREFDWNQLSMICLPISTTKTNVSNITFKGSKADLLHLIILGCRDLSENKDLLGFERLKVAMESLLLAIRDHYPSAFKKYLLKNSYVDGLIPSHITGKHIKLRRIAISNIGQYL